MSAKRALVTGCNGFVGGYLCQNLLDDGYKVHGIDLQDVMKNSAVQYHRLDIRDSSVVTDLFRDMLPDEVYHLAAVANPRTARENPALAFSTSALSTIALLEGARAVPTSQVLFVGSSEEYKRKDGDVVYSEKDEIDSDTIYGASKVVSEKIAKAYHAQYGLRVFFTRSFNHTGPGQAPVYVLSDFARQCALVKLGRQAPELVTGNVDLKRDFLDVRDVVAAYRAILRAGKPGETYNVASGRATSIRDCIRAMLYGLGLEGVTISVDPARIRPEEPTSIRGQVDLIRKRTGWEPSITIDRTARELALYWLGALGSSDGAGD